MHKMEVVKWWVCTALPGAHVLYSTAVAVVTPSACVQFLSDVTLNCLESVNVPIKTAEAV